MRRIKTIVAIALSLLLAGSMAGCGAKQTTSSALRLGTGGIGGTYYTYGTTLNQLYSGDSEEMKLKVKVTAGSAANLRLISKDFLELGLVQSDILMDAAAGQGLFREEGAITNVLAVAGLYTEACQIVVPADSDIQTVADLQGRTVSVGEEESGVVRNAQQILQAYGLTFDNIEKKNLSFADSAAAMAAGEIDAFFCTAGAPTAAVTELSRDMNIRLLSIEEERAAQMMSLYSGFTTCTIPAGTYAGQTEDVPTVGVKAVLVASAKAPEEQIRALTETLFSHATELKYATGAATELDMSYAVEHIPVELHPGAAAYYKEGGH